MKKSKIPSTSLAAFQSLDQLELNKTYRDIIFALSQLQSATSQEISAYLKTDHSKIWKRMSECERLGYIYKSGTKKPLRSGRMGYCYCLKGALIPTTQAAEKALKGKAIVDFSKEITNISKQAKQQNLF